MNLWAGRGGAQPTKRRLLLVLPAPSHCHLPSNNITWLLPDFQDDVGAPSKSSDSSVTAEEGTETLEGPETPLTDSERAKSDKGGEGSLLSAASRRAGASKQKPNSSGAPETKPSLSEPCLLCFCAPV